MASRVRHSIQFIEHDQMNGELRVVSDDEAASLLWAAQWLDEHRECTVTAIRLEDTSNPDDDRDSTTAVIVTVNLANEHEPGRLGPWPHGVPPLDL